MPLAPQPLIYRDTETVAPPSSSVTIVDWADKVLKNPRMPNLFCQFLTLCKFVPCWLLYLFQWLFQVTIFHFLLKSYKTTCENYMPLFLFLIQPSALWPTHKSQAFQPWVPRLRRRRSHCCCCCRWRRGRGTPPRTAPPPPPPPRRSCWSRSGRPPRTPGSSPPCIPLPLHRQIASVGLFTRASNEGSRRLPWSWFVLPFPPLLLLLLSGEESESEMMRWPKSTEYCLHHTEIHFRFSTCIWGVTPRINIYCSLTTCSFFTFFGDFRHLISPELMG